MRIAQLVLTQPTEGHWKIAVMSLTQTELTEYDLGPIEVPSRIMDFIDQFEWEHLGGL